MAFTLTINGDVEDPTVAEGEEQSFVDDVEAVIAKHKAKITYAVGNFQFSGNRDLLAAAPAGSETDDPHPDVFVTKLAGEEFPAYKVRLFEFNASHPDAQVPTAQQYGDDRQAEWEALPIG